LPAPVDPAAAPRWLARAAGIVALGGVFLLLVGAKAALGDHPAVEPRVFLIAWLASLPLSAALALAAAAVRRARVRAYERRWGFLPRAGRKDPAPSGRTTLFRLEYGGRRGRVCLMVARWDLTHSGWQRRRVVEHAWIEGDDAVELGEERARLSALAERLEEEVDDARLAATGPRLLAEELATDPSWAP
jgi:hypothetical protein